MKIALAQLNPTVGDLRGNAALVRAVAAKAASDGADLLITSELLISGYPPKDLLLREGFAHACDRAVSALAKELPSGLAVLIGHPTKWGVTEGRIANAATLLLDGEVRDTIHKSLLPNYDVFDEQRYFRPAERVRPIELHGRKLGVHICEDAWYGEPNTFYHDRPLQQFDPVAELISFGAEVLINLSASPFEKDKPHRRLNILRRHVSRHRKPFVFVNQVGGNDDLVFDGNSIALDDAGNALKQLAPFDTDLQIIDLPFSLSPPLPLSPSHANRPREADLLDALVLGLRDYLRKSGFTDCVLGLSGGIDSALAAYIAAQAAGKEHVHGLLMPSRYSSEHSVSDAKLLAENLGIDHAVIPIDEMHRAYEATHVVGADLASQPGGLADQNLQARIRGALVMIRSNRHGWLALATGNKSELAVGYCTLYGDMAGGFAVLCDLFKRDVYAVSRYINEVRERREVIPISSITKAPSAELAPNQFDQDTLPPYDVLDAILEGLIEREESVATLSRQFPIETVRWVASKLDRNEFKRRQMPPGIKLTSRAFGSGRRMPMAAKFDWS
ncbi:MAG: NAD+ synthase (glutamine-hydrolysing) [Planctomycetota bacterium]|nr:MAG: NAD+ synthase (glutamine-hydrolysing) [Planctomycetota bacterium]